MNGGHGRGWGGRASSTLWATLVVLALSFGEAVAPGGMAATLWSGSGERGGVAFAAAPAFGLQLGSFPGRGRAERAPGGHVWGGPARVLAPIGAARMLVGAGQARMRPVLWGPDAARTCSLGSRRGFERAAPLALAAPGGGGRSDGQAPGTAVGRLFAQVCKSIRGVLASLGLVAGEPRGGPEGAATAEQVERFAKALGDEVNEWVQTVQGLDERKLQDLKSSLDAVSELLNRGVFSSGQTSVSELLETWRTTDPATRDLFRTVRRIRAQYAIGVRSLTDTVKPLSEEEIFAAARPKLQEIVASIDANVAPLADQVPPPPPSSY